MHLSPVSPPIHGWRLRFKAGPGRFTDANVLGSDLEYAIRLGRAALNLNSDSPWPLRWALYAEDCRRLGLRPGQVLVE